MKYLVTIRLSGGRSIQRTVECTTAEYAISVALNQPEVQQFINGESPIAITADQL
jgi:hypothetical protein